MTSISETGHAKNVANFEDLISFCQGYGATYNPVRDNLKIAQLQTMLTSAEAILSTVRTSKTAYDIATNNRRLAFEDLKPFSTKVLNAFIVSGADKLAIDDLKGINKKIQGTGKKKTTIPTTPTTDEPTPKSISTSQQSYDRQIDHLANLIQVLELNTIYNPNENELKLQAIKDKLTDLKSKITNHINAYTQYSNAISERNKVLYDPLTGLVQTAKEIKQYVKSIFGATSSQFRQISGIEFKVRKG